MLFVVCIISSVLARYMLTSQWYQQECHFPPDVMYAWNLTDESASRPPRNTVWPMGYQNQASKRPFNRECFGTLKVALSKSCCAVSANLTASRDWLSSSTILADPLNPLLVATESAKGGVYCSIEAVNKNSSSLFGMERAYYHANGVCIGTDSVRCHSNKTFEIYPLSNCRGTPVVQLLSDLPTNFTTSKTLAVIARMMTLETGTTQYSWSVLIPTQIYVPSFAYWNDWMLIILYVGGILLILCSAAYHLHNFLKRKTMYLGMVFMSQVFWILFLTLRLASSWGNFNDTYDGGIYLVQMLGSLTAILNSVHFCLNMQSMERKWYYWGYSGTIFIHLAMNWNNYTRWNLIDMSTVYTRDVVAVLTKINFTWLFFMFIFDLLPPLYVVIRMLRSFECSPLKKVQVLWNTDKWFILITVFQALNLLLYIIQDQLRSNSELLGHDRVWLSMISVEAFSQSVHCVMNDILIEKMVYLVKGKSLLTALNNTKFGTVNGASQNPVSSEFVK